MPWRCVTNYTNPPKFVIDYFSYYTPSIKASHLGALGGTRTHRTWFLRPVRMPFRHQGMWWLWLVSIQPPRLMRAVRIHLRHTTKFGVSYRYRSGTTAFTEQGAGHYTKDTI